MISLVFIILSTWPTFLLSLFIGFSKISVLTSLLIISACIAYPRIEDKINTIGLKDIASAARSITFTHAIVLLAVMSFFIFGMWESESGDIMFLGNYIDLS